MAQALFQHCSTGTMGLECAQSHVLVRKLGFFKKRVMMIDGVGVGVAAVKAPMDDAES